MHTPEPWHAIEHRRHGRIYNSVVADGVTVCLANAGHLGVTEGEAAENLRRIVACVNALKGIPTSELAGFEFQAALDEWRNRFA